MHDETPTSRRILVVDDDKAVRAALNVNLSKSGMTVSLATHPDEAIAILEQHPIDAVITDVKMPGATGFDLLHKIRQTWPDLPVVLMTGQGSVPDAVAAMKAGAVDYIIKPITKDELLLVLERALELRALQAEVVALRSQVRRFGGLENIVGTTPVMQRLYEDILAVATTSATILLQGPTGTGKELLAHAIHTHSQRSNGLFIPINCAAIPENLLESELFGHEKGSFSGAIRQHLGKFEQAHGGTLLLDEIGEIDPFMQVKLLRVLQDGCFQRVGGTQQVRVDVRVIAATNRNLKKEVEEGRFRQDLFYRLNVVTFKVPSLAERREDIPLLVEFFIRKYVEKYNRPIPKVRKESIERLMDYSWPGNVRQLEHVVERSIILHRDGALDLALPEDAPHAENSQTGSDVLPPPGTNLQEALEQYERRMITAALEEVGGVQARAARRLGISRSNLNYRIGRLGIRLRDVSFE